MAEKSGFANVNQKLDFRSFEIQMKKLFLFTLIAVAAVACNNNPAAEAQEQVLRDSSDNVQEEMNQAFVDSMMAADEKAQALKDSLLSAEPKKAEQ